MDFRVILNKYLRCGGSTAVRDLKQSTSKSPLEGANRENRKQRDRRARKIEFIRVPHFTFFASISSILTLGSFFLAVIK